MRIGLKKYNTLDLIGLNDHHIVEPYLHVEKGGFYNPLTDRKITAADRGYEELRAIQSNKYPVAKLKGPIKNFLIEKGWLVDKSVEHSHRFFLKFVSLEAHTVCNQACYFCPVSVNPRESYFMPMELYEQIVRQLTDYRNTIEAVFMINYNEPTADKRFLDQVRLLKENQLPPAINTNGTGLTPKRVDALMEMGGLAYLSVNLTTLSRQSYAKERQHDQLDLVIRNLDYVKNFKLAQQMEIAVLGQNDQFHKQNFDQIVKHFANSNFNIKYYELMDRAGYMTVGLKPLKSHKHLCGCENVGSRPLQHLHITPYGKCVLCCEDYDNNYEVGDLTKQTVNEILNGPLMALMRRWTYGIEEAPEDFMCRKCIFALTR